MPVSAVITNKLINGEFKTFEEFYQKRFPEMGFESKDQSFVNVLFREIENKNRKGLSNYIIETIFIDE